MSDIQAITSQEYLTNPVGTRIKAALKLYKKTMYDLAQELSMTSSSIMKYLAGEHQQFSAAKIADIQTYLFGLSDDTTLYFFLELDKLQFYADGVRNNIDLTGMDLHHRDLIVKFRTVKWEKIGLANQVRIASAINEVAHFKE